MMLRSNELGLITFIKYGVATMELIPSGREVNVVLPNKEYAIGDVCSLVFNEYGELVIEKADRQNIGI